MKTPRMVKQASKKNSKVKRSGSGEEDSESLEVWIRSFYAVTFLLDPSAQFYGMFPENLVSEINRSSKCTPCHGMTRLMSRLTLWTRMILHLRCLEATSHRCTTSSLTRESTFFYFKGKLFAMFHNVYFFLQSVRAKRWWQPRPSSRGFAAKPTRERRQYEQRPATETIKGKFSLGGHLSNIHPLNVQVEKLKLPNKFLHTNNFI